MISSCALLQRLGLETEAALALSHRAIVRSYAAGSTICSRGARHDHWQLVVSGLAVSTRLFDARPIPLLLHPPGSWINEEFLLPAERAQADYTAVSDVNLLLLPSPDVLHAASGFPAILPFIVRETTRKAQQLCEAIFVQKLGEPLLRVVATLAAIVEHGCAGKNGVFCASPANLELELSQAALADLCGVSRTVLSYHLRVLKGVSMVKISYKSVQLCQREHWIRFSRWLRSAGSAYQVLSMGEFLDIVSRPEPTTMPQAA